MTTDPNHVDGEGEIVNILDAHEPLKDLREIGEQAVWSLSSFKPGFGVANLRDGSTETYWQSDSASQPHLINIQFPKRTHVSLVALYLDYRTDESYTPTQLAIRAGTCYADLEDISLLSLVEPSGWLVVPLSGRLATAGTKAAASLEPPPLRANLVQVSVLGNAQSGRDTHIRAVKVFSPPVSTPKPLGTFTSPEFRMFAQIR